MTDLAAAAAALPSPHDPRCAACGYDLRALEQHRCPECGLAFDPNFLPTADIPWLRRTLPGGSNAFVAYWATVFLVLARPRRFGEIVWSDVEVQPTETAPFRAITIGVAAGSVLATLLPVVGARNLGAVFAVLVVIGFAATVFFWAATEPLDVVRPSAGRHADELRFRRLHDLSCAGLALSPIVPAAQIFGMLLDADPSWLGGLLLLVALVGAAWWYGSLRFQIHAGRCDTSEAILHAMLLPLGWLALAAGIVTFSLAAIGWLVGVLR